MSTQQSTHQGTHQGKHQGGQQTPTPSRLGALLAFLRNTWRGLTAMRTALTLLFLLALGAMPGALLPQRSLNANKTDQYIADHGWWGQLLDRLQFFDVYSSVWFSAIYILLFVSLIGCLLPRSLEYVRQLRAKPVLTPRNLGRLPHHRRSTVDASPDAVLAVARKRLRGWRVVEHTEDDGVRSISAERGFLRETGNLVFHFSLLGILVAFALGGIYKYEGHVIVLANGGENSEFCNAGVANYDYFVPGLSVDGTHLNPFCVKVNSVKADYLPNGQPVNYQADIEYQSGQDLTTGTWRPYDLRVNSPLRTAGDRVYLLSLGYAPQFTVTYPDGTQRSNVIQWEQADALTLLSSGATKFDPPDMPDPEQRRKSQLAVTGLFAPTASYDGTVLSSSFPDLRDPAVAVDIYRGDLGSDSGRGGQSIYTIDQSMVDSGRLQKVARKNLALGEEITLDDGTRVKFDKVERWASLQVSHDPTQNWVLVFSVLMLVGLATSLVVKRRRVWVRVTPTGAPGESSRTVVEVGGLARTDQAGYGEEFTKVADELLRAARAGRES